MSSHVFDTGIGHAFLGVIGFTGQRSWIVIHVLAQSIPVSIVRQSVTLHSNEDSQREMFDRLLCAPGHTLNVGFSFDFQVGNLFGSKRSTIITVYNGAFDSSAVVFLIIKVRFAAVNSHNISRD